MELFSYRYELKRGEEMLATGHLNRDTPLDTGDRITINGREGIIRSVEPQLGEPEQRLVIQLLCARTRRNGNRRSQDTACYRLGHSAGDVARNATDCGHFGRNAREPSAG